jgi:hypothetical protein
MKMQRVLTWILTLSLLVSVAALGATPAGPDAGSSAAAASAPPQGSASSEQPKSERPQPSPRQQRSYQRETHNQDHGRISKKEWLFLGAVAGTSMSIGAIAAGGKGLAIGTLVGGWAAYGAHRVWRWLR